MRPIKIAVFDNEPAELDRMMGSLNALFNRKRFPIDIHSAVLPEKIEKIEKLLTSVRPEIVFFDNHIGKGANEAMYGQAVISFLKPKFPDSLFVLLSKEALRKDSLDKQYPTPDIFVSKIGLELGYEDYTDWVYSELMSRMTRSRIESIDASECVKSFQSLRAKSKNGGRRPIKDEEVRSLVEQACFTGGLPEDNVIEEVKLRPLYGGFSGAVVAEVSVRNRYGEFAVPAVMKFMDRKSADREAHNHAKFVKWVLPYRWRVDVIGRGATDEFGCVTYSFAHGGAGSPDTLTSLIRNGDEDRVLSVMKAVFSPGSKAWYSNTRDLDVPLGLYLARKLPYAQRLADGASKEDLLLSILAAHLPAADGSLTSIGGVTVASVCEVNIPITEFQADLAAMRIPAKTVECVSHGDLNSGNILIRSGSDEFCFIDFQHTGWHHRAMDFCSFEGSVRTLVRERVSRTFSQRVRDEFDGWERMEQETWLSDGPMKLIDETRRLFLLNHSGSAEEFALASIYHTLWLLGFDTWNDFEKRRLLAFFLATLWWLRSPRSGGK